MSAPIELKAIARVEQRPGAYAWRLAGPHGVVDFVAGPLDLPADYPSFGSVGATVEGRVWLGIDVGFHSTEPRYEGQAPYGLCPLLDGVTGYCDGSALAADELLRRWSEASCNDDVIWTELSDRYIGWLLGDSTPREALAVTLTDIPGGAA